MAASDAAGTARCLATLERAIDTALAPPVAPGTVEAGLAELAADVGMVLVLSK